MKNLRDEARNRMVLSKVSLQSRVDALARLCVDNSGGRDSVWGSIHGDLHAANILEVEDGVRFIDYGKTRCGPPAVDYVTLEWDLRLRFVREALGRRFGKLIENPAKWCDRVLEAIGEVERRIDKGWNDCPQLTLTAARAIRAARMGRRLALAGPYRDRPREYWLVTLLYCVRILHRYAELADDPLGPVGMLWAASVARDVLDTHFKITKPGTLAGYV